MDWWNGVSLNEAFATFLEMVAVDAWKPQWQRSTSFGVSRSAAFAVDGLHGAQVHRVPGGHAGTPTPCSTCSPTRRARAPAVLEQYLGPEVFRAGVRDYLQAHAYGDASTGDLWAALGRASGQPIPALMDGWIFRPGFPIVSARLDGRVLVLEQQRFTYLQRPLEVAQAGATLLSSAPPSNGGRSPWEYPHGERRGSGSAARPPDRQRERTSRFHRSEAVRRQRHGFYRVRYGRDPAGELLGNVPDNLAPIERFNLVGDAWAAAIAGLMPITEYLDLTARFRDERDKNVWAILSGSLYTLNRIIRPSDRPGLERQRATARTPRRSGSAGRRRLGEASSRDSSAGI